MAVIKMKPTSPGHRGMVKISRDHLYKGEPYAPLLEPQFQKSGRNNNGHITTRHKGGGHKHHYRVVDFVRNKDGIPAKVERIEYDPNRTAHLALVCYADGERRYIIAPRGLEVGSVLLSGSEAPIRAGNTLPVRNKDGIPAKVERIEYDPNRTAHLALVCYADGERRYIIAPRGLEVGSVLLSGSEAPIRAGNTLPVRNIPVGSTIHCIELQPGKGAQIARSAGTSATLLAREGTYAQVRMRSGEVRKIHIECRATIGEVANEEHSLRQLGKAGVKRHMGIRPTVRGVVMNPVDHPHGGGEGKTGEGRHPVDPWGNLTKGYRTRNNKRTQVMIVARRKK